MVYVLLCSPVGLEAEVHRTLLGRDGIELQVVRSLEEALLIAVAAKPDLVIVDGELPAAERLVATLRQDHFTRHLSVAIVVRGEFDPAELRFLEKGANAVLRMPPGPEWDERLLRLIDVPARKEVRVPLRVEVEAAAGPAPVGRAMALDLSVSGMLLESPVPLSIGCELRLAFRIPALVTAHGRVVREAGALRYGVELVGLEDPERERIRAFLRL